MRFIESVRAKNVLSFGDPGLSLELRDLNIIIGPNSSGKSNLVSLLALLQAAPLDVTRPVSGGGGIHEWLWKGGKDFPSGEIEVVLNKEDGGMPLRYGFSFREEGQRFMLFDERLENRDPEHLGQSDVRFYYRSDGGRPTFSIVATEEEESHMAPGRPGSQKWGPLKKRLLRREEVQPNQSVLAQRRGPEQYPEITYVAESFAKIKIYQDWQFNRFSAVRLPQGTDLPNDYLLEDASNLALVLDDVKFSGLGAELRRYLELANPNFRTPVTRTVGGSIQLFIEESDLKTPTPATRLSQGALQLLCLLVVLLHPRPPKLVCIEEPEKGLHPDILPELAKLLVTASERMQLIVTTHSEILIDALTAEPESVLVCEKHKGQTVLKRLMASELEVWLKNYGSLGPLWRAGTIGGNRW